MLNNEKYDKKGYEFLFKQYELYVKSTEKVTLSRGIANGFFVTINTIIFGLFSSIVDLNKMGSLFFSIVGILLCITWELVIRSYRNLNKAKFGIINEKLEIFMPMCLYSLEWDRAKNTEKKRDRYVDTSILETVVPCFFLLLYLIIALCYFNGFSR